MKSIASRLEKLESSFKPKDEWKGLYLLSNDEIHRQLVDHTYRMTSYNGYLFKSLEDYNSMTPDEQTHYINEITKILEPWAEEAKKAYSM
jgi:hypothetical protein